MKLSASLNSSSLSLRCWRSKERTPSATSLLPRRSEPGPLTEKQRGDPPEVNGWDAFEHAAHVLGTRLHARR
jgi:hypothetical protein